MEEKTGIDVLFQTWASALKRAVETVTGEMPTVGCEPDESESRSAELDSYFWWKQVFISEHTFAVWFGAPEQTWSRISAAVDNQDESTAEETFLEILGHAHRATASALNEKTSTPIRSEGGNREQPDDLSALVTWRVNVSLEGETLPSLLMAAEPAAAKALATGITSQPVKTIRSGPEGSNPMLQRLMDLQLPLAVTLGRAVLPIHDILKLTSGSLIELDRNVGEYVDLTVHGTVVARGEIVSVKGNYGVRIKEIMSRQDRLALPRAA